MTAACSRSKPKAPKGTITGHLKSAHMPEPVAWTIAMPPATPTGIVYCLHGRNGNENHAFSLAGLDTAVRSANAGIVIAGVNGGANSYWHQREDGSNALAMLLDEFIPFAERRVGLTNGRRAVMGWSMGGYGALLAAETAPERFRAVVAVSSALWTTAGDTAPGAFDDAADYHAHDVFADTAKLAGMTVRVDCGIDDPFYESNRAFVANLPRPPEGGFTEGGHTEEYWREMAPAEVATLQQAFRA